MKRMIPSYILMTALMSCSPQVVKEISRQVQSPSYNSKKEQVQEIQKPEERHNAAIFSGHMQNPTGKNNKGTLSSSNIFEFEYNDDLTSRIHDAANVHFKIYSSSANIPLMARMDSAKNSADIYIEIHHDAAQDLDIAKFNKSENSQKAWDSAKGYSIFANPNSNESMDLADKVSQELIKQGFISNKYHKKPIKGEGRHLIKPDRGIYDGLFLQIIKNEKIPAILIECGVIVNPYEEPAHKDPAFHGKFADAISQGVANYFKDRQK